MKEKFDIGGMTCAACSAAVEKSVSKLDGVKEVNVSLLTNSMSVELDDNVSKDEIIKAVEDAGYTAETKKASQVKERVSPGAILSKEIDSMSFRLKVSIPLMIILMYVAMGEMFGLQIGRASCRERV